MIKIPSEKKSSHRTGHPKEEKKKTLPLNSAPVPLVSTQAMPVTVRRGRDIGLLKKLITTTAMSSCSLETSLGTRTPLDC